MKQSIRLKKLLTLLLNAENYLTSKEIATTLNVSTRTIFNDLNSNQFTKMLFGATLIRKEKTGIRLETDDMQIKKISYLLYDNEFIQTETTNYFSEVENIILYFLH